MLSYEVNYFSLPVIRIEKTACILIALITAYKKVPVQWKKFSVTSIELYVVAVTRNCNLKQLLPVLYLAKLWPRQRLTFLNIWWSTSMFLKALLNQKTTKRYHANNAPVTYWQNDITPTMRLLLTDMAVLSALSQECVNEAVAACIHRSLS